MIKFLILENLWESMEYSHSKEEAGKLDNKIRECELIRFYEESCRAYFLKKDENKIIELFPEIKEHGSIQDFETLIEWEYEIDEIEIGEITIDCYEVQEEANYYFLDDKKKSDLWETEDIDKELKRLRSIFIGNVLTDKIKRTLKKYQESGYIIDWKNIESTVKKYRIKAE
jgi:hypothetical protein